MASLGDEDPCSKFRFEQPEELSLRAGWGSARKSAGTLVARKDRMGRGCGQSGSGESERSENRQARGGRRFSLRSDSPLPDWPHPRPIRSFLATRVPADLRAEPHPARKDSSSGCSNRNLEQGSSSPSEAISSFELRASRLRYRECIACALPACFLGIA